MTTIRWRPQPSAYRRLLRAFCQEADEVVLVGGVVRDLLLSEATESPPIADLDLLLPVEALAISRRVADRLGWAYYALDERRGLARLVLNKDSEKAFVCDISSYFGNSLEEDLESRDFTINAMAFVASEEADGTFAGDLIDLHNGRQDLRDGIIRQVKATSLRSDPVRLLRAIRFAAQLGFAVEPETYAKIPPLAERIQLSSRERIRDELWKMLSATAPQATVAELRVLGLLQYLLPDVDATVAVSQSPPHHLDVFEHSLLAVRYAGLLRDWLIDESPKRVRMPQAVEAMLAMLATWRLELQAHFRARSSAHRTRAAWLPWHAMLHDIGKPQTQSEEFDDEAGALRIRFFGHEERGAELVQELLPAMRFSSDEVRLGRSVARAHMRPHHLHQSFRGRGISRRASYRFFRDVGFDGDDRPYGVDVILLALADRLATGKDLAQLHTPPKALEEWPAYLAHMDQLLDFAFSEEGLSKVRAQPIVGGHLLIERLGLEPGPTVGRLLKYLAEAQAAGEIRTEEEALHWATDWLQKND